MYGGRGRNSGGRGRGSGGFNPLACYRCGVHGHLTRDCASTSLQTLSSGSSGPTTRGSFKSGQSGPKRGRGVKGRFDSGEGMYCTIMRVMNTLLAIKVNCIFPSDSNRLLPRKATRKKLKIQKTKKILR